MSRALRVSRTLSRFCDAGVVSPCADANDFVPTATIAAFGGVPCSSAPPILYGATAATCGRPVFDDGSGTTVSAVLAASGAACCGGAAVNPMCSTSATPGEMCASPSDFQPNNTTPNAGLSCSQYETTFQTNGVFANASMCNAFPPNSSTPWGALLQLDGPACCTGGAIAGYVRHAPSHHPTLTPIHCHCRCLVLIRTVGMPISTLIAPFLTRRA
jgi:hypothetical protein